MQKEKSLLNQLTKQYLEEEKATLGQQINGALQSEKNYEVNMDMLQKIKVHHYIDEPYFNQSNDQGRLPEGYSRFISSNIFQSMLVARNIDFSSVLEDELIAMFKQMEKEKKQKEIMEQRLMKPIEYSIFEEHSNDQKVGRNRRSRSSTGEKEFRRKLQQEKEEAAAQKIIDIQRKGKLIFVDYGKQKGYKILEVENVDKSNPNSESGDSEQQFYSTFMQRIDTFIQNEQKFDQIQNGLKLKFIKATEKQTHQNKSHSLIKKGNYGKDSSQKQSIHTDSNPVIIDSQKINVNPSDSEITIHHQPKLPQIIRATSTLSNSSRNKLLNSLDEAKRYRRNQSPSKEGVLHANMNLSNFQSANLSGIPLAALIGQEKQSKSFLKSNPSRNSRYSEQNLEQKDLLLTSNQNTRQESLNRKNFVASSRVHYQAESNGSLNRQKQQILSHTSLIDNQKTSEQPKLINISQQSNGQTTLNSNMPDSGDLKQQQPQNNKNLLNNYRVHQETHSESELQKQQANIIARNENHSNTIIPTQLSNPQKYLKNAELSKISGRKSEVFQSLPAKSEWTKRNKVSVDSRKAKRSQSPSNFRYPTSDSAWIPTVSTNEGLTSHFFGQTQCQIEDQEDQKQQQQQQVSPPIQLSRKNIPGRDSLIDGVHNIQYQSICESLPKTIQMKEIRDSELLLSRLQLKTQKLNEFRKNISSNTHENLKANQEKILGSISKNISKFTKHKIRHQFNQILEMSQFGF